MTQAAAVITPAGQPVGELLRQWRVQRRRSQLDLALDAEISTRHLSFLETGRARPSREMLIRLCEQLEVPLRARNALLLAAGFAPVYPERGLSDPAMADARRAVELILAGHEPYPALAIDRRWTLVAANAAVGPLIAGVAPHLTAGEINVLRLSLHPEGLAPRIVNLAEWRRHIFERLRRQVEATADGEIQALLDELRAYPAADDGGELFADLGGVAARLQLRTQAGVLAFLTTTTVFGTPLDITLSELALETFFPADAATAAALRG